jgi:hypothetical protein
MRFSFLTGLLLILLGACNKNSAKLEALGSRRTGWFTRVYSANSMPVSKVEHAKRWPTC